MSDAWPGSVNNVATEIAATAEHRSMAWTMVEQVASMLVTLGKAAGHADQLPLQGSAAHTAREHFRQHMLDVGVAAVLMLRHSREQQGLAVPTAGQVTHEIARQRVIPARAAQTPGRPAPGGHAAASLGEAITALARVVPLIPDQEDPSERDRVMETVLAAAITAVALAPR